MTGAAPIQPGDHIRYRDALNAWHTGTAVTSVEGTHRYGKRVHDFPVIWITGPGWATDTQPAPWPAEDVEKA